MALTLRDAVARALVGNPGPVDARMDRMLQRFDTGRAMLRPVTDRAAAGPS